MGSLLSQMAAGLLELLGPHISEACLTAVEEAIERARAEGMEAPSLSWRRLGMAYKRSGLNPGSKALVRELLMWT